MNGPEEHFVARATDDAFIKMLSNVLLRIVSDNDSNKGVVTRFHSMNAPPISISDYLGRIARHVRCSNECFVLALVYIERITKLHKNFVVSVLNVHRLIITAVMLAAKFSDDVYYSNKFYAQVGGVNVAEINMLEVQFLSMLNFQLYVSAIEYESYRMGVEKASLFGCLSPSLWGLPWFHCSAKQAARDNRIQMAGTMPVMTPAAGYSHHQSAMSVCSTRYMDSNGSADNGNGRRLEICGGGTGYAPTLCAGTGSTISLPQSNMQMATYEIPVEQVTGRPIPMETYSFSRGDTTATATYQVLSNVHMPQVATVGSNGEVVMGTQISRGIQVNTNIYPGHMGRCHTMDHPGVGYCSKHPTAPQPLYRRKPRYSLNRMCTQHVDLGGFQHTQWNTEESPLTDFMPIETIDEHKESEEGCEVFVNALESRYRDPLKEKCALKVETWQYEDKREPYSSRQFMHFNQLHEAKYHM